ncbi:FTR1 family protein [Actinomycetospora endophytica]|uniref:FTR1 family protein n=1 Tax=Actinomycetospora endophytica TaxID=2291215 RepID=A0ABS8PBW2_9PSEU|nr:iron uptake transporter permease EfeU [Actinomycetospora endophytica]MCD2195779.1 FTR1 family protein [Actinomycetospora endophytica]
MLATFVIGLREGLEAALIVGIVAGFLRRQGPPGAVRSMWLGLGLAVAICVLVGVVLEIVAVELPQAGQEAMSTVIGLVAVGMVTYMIFWMRSHARGMRRELESAAAGAIDRGSSAALVAMAFLAVLREGFETAVFLVAQFTSSIAPIAAVSGAVLGIVVSIALGYGIYRGSVRINLGRFFTITAVVLVVVAAGILTTAAHTAHGAGWIAFGQDRLVDLSGVVSYGTPMYSIVTGVFGIQPQPTVLEGIVWVVYLVPMLAFVLWPQRRPSAAGTPSTVVTAAESGDVR